MYASFEWDEEKNAENLIKHGIDFTLAQYVFIDPNRIIAEDIGTVKVRKDIIVLVK